MNRKVVVVGAGNVGASVSQYLLEEKLADVVLMDMVGSGGVEKIIQLELTEKEQQALSQSAETYREQLSILEYG